MRKNPWLLLLCLVALILVFIGKYSAQEVAYNLGNSKPVQLDEKISQAPGTFVWVQGQADGKNIVHAERHGIDMYFYPMSGYDGRVFIVADGSPVPENMLNGTANFSGKLENLRRMPYVRYAIGDLNLKPDVDYYAVSINKKPNPARTYQYAGVMALGIFSALPILVEARMRARKRLAPAA